MGNHYHLLFRTPEANLSKAMHGLGGIFARRFNRAEKNDGPAKVDDIVKAVCQFCWEKDHRRIRPCKIKRRILT